MHLIYIYGTKRVVNFELFHARCSSHAKFDRCLFQVLGGDGRGIRYQTQCLAYRRYDHHYMDGGVNRFRSSAIWLEGS